MGRSQYWTAASTYRNEEWRAAYHAESNGFEFYLPRIYTFDCNGGHREFLFPGYILVKLKAGWETLLRLPGIYRLFMTNEKPWKMRDAEVKKLKLREDAQGFVQLKSRIPVGAKVLILDGGGVFKGMNGIYEGDLPHQRCKVLMSMLGNEVSVNLNTKAVEEVA